jgi:hypothetical protein
LLRCVPLLRPLRAKGAFAASTRSPGQEYLRFLQVAVDDALAVGFYRS